MDLTEVTSYMTAGRAALDLFKGIRSELPDGVDQEQLQQQLRRAEEAFELSRAELAKALGYKLCQCTFPPQIMLWSEVEQAYKCGNADCRRKMSRREVELQARNPGGGSWAEARRGRR